MTNGLDLTRFSEGLSRVARRWLRPAHFGTLRRTRPLSDRWGYDRGLPIDRHYIEVFLDQNARDVHGSVLEVGDRRYASRYLLQGGRADVIDVVSGRGADIVADLCDLEALPQARYDAFVCVQTLQYVRCVKTALEGAYRMLKPGGVLLATVPMLAPVDPGARGVDRWRFTPAQTERWVQEAFGDGAACSVEPRGNVLTACAALMRLSRQDLRAEELAVDDPDYPVILCLRAVRGPA
jgi:SAM-dependent methyltransferase